MVESQIAPSEHQDIRDHLETPMGNVSDDEEEKVQSPLMKNLENDNYLDKLTEVLKQIKAMGKPISFKAVKDRKPVMLIFGEIGNGKSTTANFIMYHLEKRNNREIGDRIFESKQSPSAVTKHIQSQEFNDMIIVDTPGYNDPNFQNRSDAQITNDIIKYVSDK